MAVTCTVCKGAKVQVVTSSTYGKPEEDKTFEMPCIICRGEGVISESLAAAVEAELNAWCKCKSSHGVTFHPDSPWRKHHYTCNRCNKIVQEG